MNTTFLHITAKLTINVFIKRSGLAPSHIHYVNNTTKGVDGTDKKWNRPSPVSSFHQLNDETASVLTADAEFLPVGEVSFADVPEGSIQSSYCGGAAWANLTGLDEHRLG